MTRPGERLRAWASRFVSANAMTRVVDPAIADFQLDYATAKLERRIWGACWTRLTGTFSVLNALRQVATHETWQEVASPSADDRRVGIHLAGWCALTLLLVTCLLAGPASLLFAERLSADRLWVVSLLVPQALPVAIPIAVAIGVAIAVGGRQMSRHLLVIMVALAITSSAASFFTIGWIAPAANQVFREATALPRSILTKGSNELTLGELRTATRTPLYGDFYGDRLYRARAQMRYYMRFALPCAPLVLTLATLAFRSGALRRWRRGLAGLAVCGAYYSLMLVGEVGAIRGVMPAIAGAWLPHAALAALTLAVWPLRHQPAEST